MNARVSMLCGAISGLFAVALGAFGAHALREILVPPSLVIWEKASHYHFIHSLALLATGTIRATNLAEQRWVTVAAWCFLLGVLLFSGSLYIYAVTVERLFALVTPIGGTLFLIGWLSLCIATVKRQKDEHRSSRSL